MLPGVYQKVIEDPFFSRILDCTENAILILDEDVNVVFVNNAYCQLFQTTPEMIVGKRLKNKNENTIAVRALKTGKAIIDEPEFLPAIKMDSVGRSFPIFHEDKVVGSISAFNSVLSHVELVARLNRSEELNAFLQDQLNDADMTQWSREYITVNPFMKRMLGLAIKVSRSNSTVMINGESGTGKEVIAKIIHYNSQRKDGPFVKINCAAIPSELMESELFGYERGAFTGANKEGKPGKFEMAQNGTIFLDEIGDMPMEMQVKLLRVLQERVVERVGGTKAIPLDIRVVAATNQNLPELIQKGKFRLDLFYRLNVIEIKALPLRERKEDIPLLIHSTIQKITNEDVLVTPKAMDILVDYDWPGNVRELMNVMEHALVIRNNNVIHMGDLPYYLQSRNGVMEEEDSIDDLSYDLKSKTEVLEKTMILKALKDLSSKSAAIKELGISRSSFYEKIRKYGIDVDSMDIA